MTDLATRPDDLAETKGERTRRRLIEIAIERFGANGFRSTSVSEIARSTGLTQAAAYAYFTSKEDLFHDAVDADADALLAEARAAVAGTAPKDLVAAYVVWLVALLDRHPLARRVLAGQEPEVIGRLAALPALERFSDFLAGELRLGQELGEIRADIDPDVLAPGIEALVLGVLFTTVQAETQTLDPKQVNGVLAAFDAMLRPA